MTGTKDQLRNRLRTGTEPWVWSNRDSESHSPGSLVDALRDPYVILVAHNAYFEQVITRFILSRGYNIPKIPPERWICTASMARAVALPGNLDGATSALNATHQKDKEGHRLMMKLSKPRKPTKN